ncbi:lysoplasmalogenase [Spirosoma koreense]
MMPKPALRFNVAFVGITLLEMLGDTLNIQWLHYACKPLIIGSLFVFTGQHFSLLTGSKAARWVLIGMGFALAGDVFLMIREVDLFAPGLGAFLAMQLCYCIAFWQSTRQPGYRLNIRSFWLKAILFGLYAVLFLLALRPAFRQSPTLAVLWWPVVVYAVCLCAMGLLATLRQGLPRYGQVVAGALLFMASDSVLAINKFLILIPGATWLIMSTYAAAQYLIVVGMTQALASPKSVNAQNP